MEYRIDWKIELDARSPQEAAREALEIQRDRSDATLFEVTNKDGRKWLIDAAESGSS